ncbi:MAG: c-type cytochrome [Hyphomicrobiaceae bacterium]|nr:c-type cytochrome [Hyphomicrobiaceae bacterium]
MRAYAKPHSQMAVRAVRSVVLGVALAFGSAAAPATAQDSPSAYPGAGPVEGGLPRSGRFRLYKGRSAPRPPQSPTELLDETVGYPAYPKVNYKSGAASEKVIRQGEYLVKAGDCISCHTNKTRHEAGPAFAGGLKMKTPFGDIYSPNITPDKETGIGKYQKWQFRNALRNGIRVDGSYLYPVMPFVHYNLLVNSEVDAIFAYLKSIEPVSNEPPANTLEIPFNERELLAGWRLLYFDNQKNGYRRDPKRSAVWNRGRFLVNGPGHCGMCHSPMNEAGAEEKKHYLSGDFINGYWAPDITSRGLAHVSVADIVSVFARERGLWNGQIQGDMREAVHDSLRFLTAEDQKAIATYLKTVKSEPTPPAPISSEKLPLRAGAKIYTSVCSDCHSFGGLGAPQIGDRKAWLRLVDQGRDRLYAVAVHGSGDMPFKGMCQVCTPAQIRSAVDYMIDVSLNAPDQGKLARRSNFHSKFPEHDTLLEVRK